ncbi:MAG TPA: amino acid permease [Candidatus Limnocylindria bacterium]|nr:amino acid permease [Candidatus Limnocylindria bacterium]
MTPTTLRRAGPATTSEVTTRRFGLATALLLVVASMVGTGVYTTSGFLLRDLGSPALVLLVWLVGGGAALTGALSYAELVAALPANGGEYQLLRRIYHPAVGFVAGFTSLVAGFAAPTAASAIAFGEYLAVALGPETIAPVPAALALIVVSAFVHAHDVRAGSAIQNVVAASKIVLLVVFVAGGLTRADTSLLFAPAAETASPWSPAFAVGLVYVSYAYSGWNAAAYVAGEVRAPERNVPRALVLGTVLVTTLYLGVNLMLVTAAPAAVLARSDERIGAVAAVALFGAHGGRLLAGLIAIGLVSTVGALLMTGPRITEAMGQDHPRLAALARRRPGRGPVPAIVLQAGLGCILALTATFDALLAFVGLGLSVFAALSVAGVFVLRVREPTLARPYHTWGYPATPLVFLALTTWSIVLTLAERPEAAMGAGATAIAGLLAFRWATARKGGAAPS